MLADWLFTAPTAVLQPLTGYWLARAVGYDLTAPWLLSALALFVIAGAAWLPVVAIQLRLRDLAAAALARGEPLPARYHRLMRIWFKLGVVAFSAIALTFWLMVRKPPLWGN